MDNAKDLILNYLQAIIFMLIGNGFAVCVVAWRVDTAIKKLRQLERLLRYEKAADDGGI